MKITLLLVVILPLNVLAIENWECQDHLSRDWEKILVVATIEDQKNTGLISVAGTYYDSYFYVKGFERRWDFDDFNYSFIIKPNGDASYYDFSSYKEGDRIKASMFFKCRQFK